MSARRAAETASLRLTGHGERRLLLVALLDDLVDELRAQLAGDLQSVVLSGSLARGDASTLGRNGGGFLLLSDIDLFAVVGAKRSIDGSRLRGRCEARGVATAGLDVACVAPNYFVELGDGLADLQLRQHAVEIWSSSVPWPGIPDAGPMAAVDPDDALALLQNRAGEMLWSEQRFSVESSDLRRCYRFFRLASDAALSFLAVFGPPPLGRAECHAGLRELLETVPCPAPWIMAWDAVAKLDRALVSGTLSAPEFESAVTKLRDGALQELLQCLYLAALSRCARPRVEAEASASLHAATHRRAGQLEDMTRQWLRRLPPHERLRRARRWAPLARSAKPEWWRYGWGGIGPERVRAGVTVSVLYEDDALLRLLCEPLLGVLEGPEALRGAAAELWQQWMLGDRRI